MCVSHVSVFTEKVEDRERGRERERKKIDGRSNRSLNSSNFNNNNVMVGMGVGKIEENKGLLIHKLKTKEKIRE